MAFHDHFSGVANSYAEFRPDYPSSLFAFLAAASPGRRSAWDCATGNGQAAVGLAEHFLHVEAVDASAAQVAAAFAHPRVTYRVAAAEECDLPDRSVDCVCVAQALHWLDLSRFYREVHRVLAPNGVFAAWTYGLCQTDSPEVNKLLREFYYDAVGPYWPPERRLVEQGYRTIRFPFEEIAAPTFHLEQRWTLPGLLGYLGTWSATSRCIAATGADPRATLAPRLAELWANRGDEPRSVQWPLALRVGRLDENLFRSA